jgi:Protein of unknown function (DUF2934)
MRKGKKKQTSVPASHEHSFEPRETATALADPQTDTAPQSVGDTTAATPDRERIATRAYELYVARGGGEGSALDDWLEAEREFHSRSSD